MAFLQADLELLRSHEPVLRFSTGELFLPTAIEGYVEACSLWELEPSRTARCVVPPGELDVARLLQEAGERPSADLSLRFVSAPLGSRELRAWRRRPDRPVLRSGGRFTRVGLLARLIDLLFRITLLLRGRVPGGLAAAAEVTYRTRLEPRHHPYYGHVTRDGGYTVLQYWFFYAMNDWRSTFTGANDHEADWEQVTVYVVERADGSSEPAWVALSSHDYVGDDLRRRWDDPELTREGDHPVVFVGAGSHSGAFVAGDYVTAVDPPGRLHSVLRALRAISRVVTPWARGEIARGVGIPFIDYARGDGEVIGPSAVRGWSPVIVSDDTPWVVEYAGLWGLDTLDRFGGERAPAGPRYDRGGSVRASWDDPVGWAGLHKVPPSPEASEELLRAQAALVTDELAEIARRIETSRLELRRRTATAQALAQQLATSGAAVERRAEVARLEAELRALTQRRAALIVELEAIERALTTPAAAAHPQAHLVRKAVPFGEAPDVRRRFLRVWSTISTPLLLAAVALLAIGDGIGVVSGLVTFAVAFIALEAIARGRFLTFAATVLVVVVGGLIVVAIASEVLGRWQTIVGIIFVAAALATLVLNLRELRRG